MSEQRFPLSWPAGWKRTSARIRAQFGKVRTEFDAAAGTRIHAGKARLSIEDAFTRVERELMALLGEKSDEDSESIIISTNLRVNLRGIPRADQGEPSDPGVEVYWQQKGKKECMAIDTYTRVADNLAAIAATLEHMRGIRRHGGAAILERAFLGFAQLPETTSRPWRAVMEFGSGVADASESLIQERFRALARVRHPDNKATGSHEAFVELERAYRDALEEISRK